MTIYDPHDNSFIAKNLREEEWDEYQRSDEAKELADAIKAAFSNGMVARISRDTLYDMGLDVAYNSGIAACLIQHSHHDHWAAMALCMLTHGRFQFFPDEGLYRFYKSPYEMEPMYHDNIEYVEIKGNRYLVPMRRLNEVKDTRSSGMRQDDKADGTPGRGSKERNKTGQDSFPDFY